MAAALFAGARAAAPAPRDDRDALAELWTGLYDISEQLIAGETHKAPLVPLAGQQRVQINVRRVQLPWLGSHVLYVEEYPYDAPFEMRRQGLLSIERNADGTLRVRQFTRRPEVSQAATVNADDVESIAGCDIFLRREGGQFRGGTRGRTCLEGPPGERRWLDYRLVIGDHLFWYRTRTLQAPDDEFVEEIAGFPHVDLEEARLFSCGISWTASKDKAQRRPLGSVDLHDRGGRAHFRTPDGRELTLELHGRDWPLSEGRESLVLILTDGGADSEPIASSWTSLGAANVGIDIGWLAVDCAPLAPETGEQRS